MSAQKGGSSRARPRGPRFARTGATPAAAGLLGALLVAAVVLAAVLLALLADVHRTGVLVIVTAVLCAVVVGLAVWGVRRAVARTLRPVARLREELTDLADPGPGARVGVPATGDDVERLAGRVNLLLSRLEESVEQRRAFFADASHELRTPLTGLRTRIELALHDPEEADLAGTLRDAMADVDRLHHIVEDLFVLARLDSEGRPARTRMNLRSLVEMQLARQSSAVPVTVEVEPGIEVMVNPPRLGRALGNLLANAERYAVTRIEVNARAVGEEAVIEIRDDGPGIPPADRDRVFERFARLDPARSRDKGGSGLGLPIARQIAMSHGGSLHVADDACGARLVLRLPLAR
ncbi:sensor histidine kinase [Actinomadura chokoriensis]|uniref:histidine kinase n=1 Tax=Actinomadura chokoriensis TaxID=454156 RepID=A0ABV4R1J5_9ACTN